NVLGSLQSCELHHLLHERLDADALRRRFPGFHLPEGMVGIYQPDGGFVLSERAIVAHVTAAQALGADIRAREQVLDWEARGDALRVRTSRGGYAAGCIVVTAGPWAATLVPALSSMAQPERQVLIWTQPLRPDYFRLGTFPVFILAAPEGEFYGFPVYGIPGFKLGKYHHRREATDADGLDRDIHGEDEEVLRQCIRRYFPDAGGPTMSMKTCMFTNSPDEHFILDLHPDYSERPRVCLAAGFSGHGFKFCSVVGEIMADLALEGRSRHDLRLFRLSRFQQTGPSRR
ncbi:MAG TPA: N-methyl-L-tryptophan oxidase, partial [bacterium]|nr:N-methyl-L-tryptophan oxidase [bacterium]